MSEVITCIEHQSIPVVTTRQPGQIAITKEQAGILEKLHSLPSGAFSWGHNSIKWSQYCGLVKLGSLTIEILPKVYGKEKQPGECRQALIKMLHKAGLFRTHRVGDASVGIQKYTLLDVFILEFCDELKSQVIHGKPREYVTVDENLKVLKGKLLPNEQLKHNLCHKEQLFCQYDELSEDILINRTVRYTLKLLLPRSRSSKAKKAVGQLLMQHDSIADQIITIENLKSLVFSRTTARYEKVIELCKLFIQYLSPDIASGNHESFSLIFDMNLLFERWIASMLRPVVQQQGMSLKEQGPRKYLAYRQDIDRHIFQTRPDISLLNTDRDVILIADAKWKLLDSSEAKLGVSQTDIYQMQSYANRYDVKRILLIYPKQHGLKGSYNLRLAGVHNLELTVVTIDLGENRLPEEFLDHIAIAY